MKLKIESLETINKTAQEFIDQIGNRTIFAFNGSMGAGKTTFIKAICETLGVKETVNSPTFSIVNEYEAADGRIIYHFDCYRINKIQEAFYRMGGKYCSTPTRFDCKCGYCGVGKWRKECTPPLTPPNEGKV